MAAKNPLAFGNFVPGFDFLQGLASQAVKSASGALPSLSQLPSPAQWVAPTLSVEELEKRINELKTVQFWLDQNAKALQATVTALEVQKMTLSTLKGMNLDLSAMGKLFQAPKVNGDDNADADSPKASIPTKNKPPVAKPASSSAHDAATPVDPMQWWGQLTQQFGAIAQDAMKQAGTQAVKNMAETGLAVASSQVKKGLQAAAKKIAVPAGSKGSKSKKSTRK